VGLKISCDVYKLTRTPRIKKKKKKELLSKIITKKHGVMWKTCDLDKRKTQPSPSYMKRKSIVLDSWKHLLTLKKELLCTEASGQPSWQGFLVSVFWIQVLVYIFIIFVMFYLFIELTRYLVGLKISCGACKLIRTFQIKKKRKRKRNCYLKLSPKNMVSCGRLATLTKEGSSHLQVIWKENPLS